MLTMMTWVIAIYAGTVTWIGLSIYLSATKKITLIELFIHIVVVCVGVTAAYYVTEYDILSSGVKYID